MSRSLASLVNRQSICSSCLRNFRTTRPTAVLLRRNNSSTSPSSSDDISDMFSEMEFPSPRKIKPIIERYKTVYRQAQNGAILSQIEQRAEDEEILPEEIGAGPYMPISEQLRVQMRRVLYPLTLVTAYSNPDDPKTWNGMTISSFNTVSMDPVPLISFNVKFPSTTGQMILDRELFVVNVLCQHINSAKLCALFNSRPPVKASELDAGAELPRRDGSDGLRAVHENPTAYVQRQMAHQKMEPKFRPLSGPFKDMPVYRTGYGIRLIPNVLLTSLGCQLRKVVSAGDHRIIIAEVMDVYGAVGDRPAERRRFHLQGERLEREMAQTYRNGKYVRHRTENVFDVSMVEAGQRVLLDDASIDFKFMKRRKSDLITEIE
ncbi:hypothetical protein TWF569_004397 [Orbilia oligospora]|uniref:Flavin reductase like domain-containing protein n=1 Tax=Orbilia oligospora TaxID=2813651 RepID=A0A7C8NVI6_ORBOL|nr:hypothetical protein TWF706_009904 [Orbilia oligospora]KAF3094987.1 hypothetical protein TWF102_007386 [Orbilia oligospora]KAF3098082.1 hypothetical protein TWF103_009182 [Orbilia oligospora]KAF3139428.1 hypothetical protein TWF594_006718 [Orbilia oligospora]KAF3145139.1 hypothetical protein TWF703_007723 [Orbilia oligospora]